MRLPNFQDIIFTWLPGRGIDLEQVLPLSFSSNLRSPQLKIIEIVPSTINHYDRERFWIAYYKAQGETLVNSTIGGSGSVGFNCSQETRQKMSLIHKGKAISIEQRHKQSVAMTGKSLSEATKQKISKAVKGRIVTVETRLKMSKARKGKPQPKTTGENNGRAILTKQQANEIKGSTMLLSEIMQIYGIAKTQASRVRRGLAWE